MKSFRRNRLEEIVQGVNVKGPQRVFVERRDEHDRGKPGYPYCLEYFEAIQIRHLYVEKDEVRSLGEDAAHRLSSSATLGDDFYIGGALAEQRDDPLSGQRFIVHDEDAHRQDRSLKRSGMPRVAVVPLAGPASTSRRPSTP